LLIVLVYCFIVLVYSLIVPDYSFIVLVYSLIMSGFSFIVSVYCVIVPDYSIIRVIQTRFIRLTVFNATKKELRLSD
jgi:hypothetical protein